MASSTSSQQGAPPPGMQTTQSQEQQAAPNLEAGSAPDTSKRGIGEEGQQHEQPDQSGVDPKAKPPNPGYEMLKARQEQEEKDKAAGRGR